MEALTVITAENPTAPCVFTASLSKLNTNSMKITVIVNHFPSFYDPWVGI